MAVEYMAAVSSIGKPVIAQDTYWGTYTGELKGLQNTPAGVIALVCIKDNVIPPLQHAIIFSSATCRREPYSAGDMKRFVLQNIELQEVILKDAV